MTFVQLLSRVGVHVEELQVPTRFNSMKPTMFLPSGSPFPRLKGKAAEVKWFVQALAIAAKTFLDKNKKEEQWMMAGLDASVTIEKILKDNKDTIVLSKQDAAEFLKATYTFNLLVTALAQHFHPKGVNLFNYTIKNHYLIHAGLQAQHLNPRKGWCYAGEDFMQKIRRLWQSSCHGASPLKVGSTVVRKYCKGMHSIMAARP